LGRALVEALDRESEARQAGLDCECRTIPLEVVPRAIVNRETRGVVKRGSSSPRRRLRPM
jgi:mercuric reductase